MPTAPSAAAVEGIDPRERALAQRLAYGTVQRVRTLDHAIEQLGGRPVAKLDPPVRAALRLGAYQLAYSEVAVHAAVNESVELVRAAGLERAVKFANAVLRRLTLGLRELLEALPEATPAEAALRHSYPDWVAEVWWRDLGADQARELMRAQNEPPERAVRLNAAPARAGRRRSPILRSPARYASTGSRTATWPPASSGRRAAARSWPGWPSAPSRASACSTSAPRREARRPSSRRPPRRWSPSRSTRAALASWRRTASAWAHATCGSSTPTRSSCRTTSASSTACSWTRPAPVWACSPRDPTFAGAASRCPSCSATCCAWRPSACDPGGAVVYSVCTINADENEAVVDATGLEPESLGDEWPQFAHPTRPEFLLTLPHRDHTSGFFIARLRSSAP